LIIIFKEIGLEEPGDKRAVAFIDGQNLYRHAKEAFGHFHPNYDPKKLAEAVCAAHGWTLRGVRFYTGIPSALEDPMWHAYWSNRQLAMSRAGVLVTARPLRYHEETIDLGEGKTKTIITPHEKGIDVRLALDVVRMARQDQFDVAVIFSQDQDLAEVADEVRAIARGDNRWIKVACAYPDSPTASTHRGIDGADWFKMDQNFYDACLDPRDYRQKKAGR
jgi:uncharacterized LabA/DUF88 family protein